MYTANAQGNEMSRVEVGSPLRLRDITREINTGKEGLSFGEEKVLKTLIDAQNKILKLE